MSSSLLNYLHDHLAGAKFAVSLLGDLSEQHCDDSVAKLAMALLPEIEADRAVLSNLIEQLGSESNTLKEAAAWVSEKFGRFKLTLDRPFGLFEAIELLSLGVLGKLALWHALETVSPRPDGVQSLDFAELKFRAFDQHRRLEELRLRLAAQVLPSNIASA